MNKEIYTISMGITLFEDSRYPGPVSQNPEEVNRFLAPFVLEIFKKYYPDAIDDKNNHWNYDTRFMVIRNFGIHNTQHLEFRDRNTGEIIDHTKYYNICHAAKESWQKAVMQAYPEYDHAALAEGMARASFEYFPQNGLLIGFTLLKGLVRQGTEDFMTERERNTLQHEHDTVQGNPQSVQRTLFIRFDIEKLSGSYGADSYRILFSTVSSELLAGAILRMGDSADTLAGRENVNVIGITMQDNSQLDMIRQELSASTAFMAVSDTMPFSVVDGLGQEPLVLDGTFTVSGVQIQDDRFSWAKSVWDELKKSGKATDPIIDSVNQENNIAKMFSIEYGNIQAIPFPEGTKPLEFLDANYFVVTNGKVMGTRYGVVDNNGMIVLPVTQKHSEAMFGPIKYEILNEKAILLKSNGFTLYSMTGNLILSCKKLVNLGSDMLAVSNKKKYAIVKVDGSAVSSEEFDTVLPFSDGIAVAKKDDMVFGYSEDGTIAFTLTNIDEIRGFSNGYAVFKQGKKWGAIDTKGNIALEAKWNWLRDSAFDAFVFSEATYPKMNIDHFGLVGVGDRIIMPCEYHNLEQIDKNLLKHGTMIFYQYTMDNKRYVKSLLTFGVIDLQGNEIIPQGMALIGTESEGLRAYARYYSDNNVEFGYMDENWKSMFIVSKAENIPARDAFKYGVGEAKTYLFIYDINDLFSPFSNGKAWTRLSREGRILKDGRWIDNTGQDISGAPIPPLEKTQKMAEISNSPDEIKAREALERLGSRFTTEGGYFPHKRCRRLIGDLWEIEAKDGKKSFVLSQMESLSGFSCGLIAVRDLSVKKWGFADQYGNLVVPPIYDYVRPFNNNRTIALEGKKYYIIKREAIVNNNSKEKLNSYTETVLNSNTDTIISSNPEIIQQ
ncbi:MAG TPA: WG repeat-containing protein [Clostridiaceae bacterium]|nr:WG repeat-containing protein [Clostridiaceae bacterium]